MQKTKKNENLLPYEVIIAGSQGDIDAINTIVAHYRPYVLKLSLRKEGDRYCVDTDDVSIRLQVKETGSATC